MYENQAVFNLFMRNWLNKKADGSFIANEHEIDLAVTKDLLTEEQGDIIKNTPRS